MMKRTSLILLFLGILTAGYSADWINDDYKDTNTIPVHSWSTFSYGFHSNTAHLVNAYIRGNLTYNDIQIFATVAGYKDTHDPASNYNFILNNIDLYDYGVFYRFLNCMFVSLRGAANYRPNYDSEMLIPSYYSSTITPTSTNSYNPAEFDFPSKYYLPVPLTAPGLRVGFYYNQFEIGYSQGDFSHCIPSAVMAKATFDNIYVRAYVYYQHTNPLVFEPNNFYIFGQLSAGGKWKIGEFTIGGIINLVTTDVTTTGTNTFSNPWLSLEESVSYMDYTFAMRQIYNSQLTLNDGLVFEFSLKKTFFNVTSLGLFASTDGRIYLANEINF